MPETSWYFQSGVESAGPVDGAAIREKITQGLIGRDTLLWKTGMSEWVAARDTEFDTAFDPYLAGAAAAQSMAPAQTNVAAGEVSSAPAWCLGVLPLAFILLLPFSTLAVSFVGIVLYVGVLMWDVTSIRAAGYVPSRSYWWPILLGAFGAPIYLWRRGSKIDGRRGYFALSLVSLAIYFLISVIVAVSGDIGG